MRIPPTDVLLSWPTPNYVDPHTQGQSLVVTNVVFMALITLAVALRFYSRLRNHRWLGLDDIFIGIALISSLGLGAVVIVANVRFGWNRHIWDVELTQYTGASLVAFIAKIIFTVAATATRVSLICFYFRLIRDSGHVKFRWLLRSAMAWQIAVCITFVLLIVFLCDPVDAYWDLTKAFASKCLDEGLVMLAAGIINCVSDLMVTVLPIPIIMGLNMPLKQRIGVLVLLSVGVIVTLAGILRTYYIWKALVNTYDETWYSYPLWICAAVEIDLAVLCACAPALKPLFSPLVKSVYSSTRSMRQTARDDGPSHTTPGRSAFSHLSINKNNHNKPSRISSHNSSQLGMLEDDEETKGVFGWTGWRSDATQGTGQAIELTVGKLNDADAIGEKCDTAFAKHVANGIGIEKGFDVRVIPRL